MHFYCHSARSGNALKPQTFNFKSTILTPTFSYKAEVKVTGSAAGAEAVAGRGQHPSSAGGCVGQAATAPGTNGEPGHSSPTRPG